MKNLYKYVFMGILALGLGSCDDDEENVSVTVQDTVETGAILRTVDLISNSLPIGIEDANFSVLLEEQDEFGGDLLESVDVFLTYSDGSPDVGDSSAAITDEVMVRNIAASDFTDGPFGLPRFELTITLIEMLALTNLEAEDIFGGDRFTTRLVLNLTDGRVFSDFNAGGIITGGFFASPFLYSTPVVCPVNEGTFVGDYLVTQPVPGIYGFDTFDEFGDGVILTLAEPDEDGVGTTVVTAEITLEATQRAFDGVYIPAAGVGQAARTFVLDFICGEVSLTAGQATGLQCSSGITLGPPDGEFGMYDFLDDTTFVVNLTDDESSDCAVGATQATIVWTKQ